MAKKAGKEKGSYETAHRRALYKMCTTEQVSSLRGTPYPCNTYDLEEIAALPGYLIHLHYHPLKRSTESATEELARFLAPTARITSNMQEAIDRLQSGLRIQDWKPDIVLKAFYDLDTVFFDGWLRGFATINWHSAQSWVDLERSRDAYRFELAFTEYLGDQRVAIRLNPWAILLDTPDAKVVMWSVVLHEMVVS